MIVLHNALECHDNAPRDHQEADPQRRPHQFEDDVTGYLKDGIREEKYSERNVVLRTGELEVFHHPCDFGVSDITTIQEGKDVEQSQHWQKSEVDLA